MEIDSSCSITGSTENMPKKRKNEEKFQAEPEIENSEIPDPLPKATKLKDDDRGLFITRKVEARFGVGLPCYKARIIGKESFGILIELLENAVNQDQDPIQKGTKLWTKWKGEVTPFVTPILEIMYY